MGPRERCSEDRARLSRRQWERTNLRARLAWTFGRAWKLDRATVCATLAALEEWTRTDHAARWEGYADLARSLAARCAELPGADCALRQFTLDERLVDGPVNAVVVSGCRDPAGVVARLAAGDPSVRGMLDGDSLVLCTEALRPAEVGEVAAALRSAWPVRRSR